MSQHILLYMLEPVDVALIELQASLKNPEFCGLKNSCPLIMMKNVISGQY